MGLGDAAADKLAQIGVRREKLGKRATAPDAYIAASILAPLLLTGAAHE